jgi:tRNA threonylcarbamoyladenosine biosynthesis protein TsaB
MLLIATDTSGKNGSVALARVLPAQSDIEIVEVVPLTGGAFSAQLIPQIAALLRKHGYCKSDLGAFAVASGPGSFTGLRVGLAAIKALAEVLRKPIAAISLLEAVACSRATFGVRGRVLAALDAGRGDVYVGDYEFDRPGSQHTRMLSERLLSRKEFLSEASRALDGSPEGELKTVVCPDPALAEVVQTAGIRAELIDYPSSAMIARLGWDHLQRGETVPADELEANYIRRSDAEIFSKPVL